MLPAATRTAAPVRPRVSERAALLSQEEDQREFSVMGTSSKGGRRERRGRRGLVSTQAVCPRVPEVLPLNPGPEPQRGDNRVGVVPPRSQLKLPWVAARR